MSIFTSYTWETNGAYYTFWKRKTVNGIFNHNKNFMDFITSRISSVSDLINNLLADLFIYSFLYTK